MKIVHLTFSLGIGGAEYLLVDIVNEQARSEDVSLIVINNVIAETVKNVLHKNVKVYYLNRVPGRYFNFLFIARLWQVLLLIKPGVIHCHNNNLIRLLFYWRQSCCLTVHDVLYPVATIKLYKKVFSISKAVQKDLFDRGKIHSTVVLNGINTVMYKKKRCYKWLLYEPFKIVQVGRLMHEKKGQLVALKAISFLKQQYKNLLISIDFIGEGPSLSYLKKLSVSMGISESVHFTGALNRSDLQYCLKDYHLLVQPSLYEGFGLTVVEGLASGLPVIASNVDGPKEVLKGIPAGFLFEPGNATALAHAILQVNDLYKENKISGICAQSDFLISKRYSIKRVACEYLNEYASFAGI